MSFKNFLDLRKKEIKIVEQVVFSKRSIKANLFLSLFAVFIVSSVIWGISKADYANSAEYKMRAFKQMLEDKNIPREQRVTLSTRGNVSEINDSTILIFGANDSTGQEGFSYTIDLQFANMKSDTGEEFLLSDLKLGHEVVAKGLLEGNTIIAHTVIVFEENILLDISTTTEAEIATTTETEIASGTSTASTTVDENVDGQTSASTATTSLDESTTTESATESSTSTTFIENATDAIADVVEAIVETISDVADIVTGESESNAETSETSQESNISSEEPTEPEENTTEPEVQSEQTNTEPAEADVASEETSPEPVTNTEQ